MKYVPNLAEGVNRTNLTYAKILIILLAFTCFNTACIIDKLSTDPDNDNWHSNGIKGSGNLISEIQDVDYFHSVAMCTAGLVNVSQKEEQSVVVKVDDNILPYITVEVINHELTIGVVSGVSLSNYNLTIDITMTDLTRLTTNSAGNIHGKTAFEADKVTLMANSAGNISLKLYANQLNSILNSAGNLTLSGEVDTHHAMLSSAGSMSAFDLSTDTSFIMINSVGSAQVSVSSYLDVTINSVGSVYYKGNPVVVQRINSIGRIYDVN